MKNLQNFLPLSLLGIILLLNSCKPGNAPSVAVSQDQKDTTVKELTQTLALDTILRLDELQQNDSAIFLAPNNESYFVSSVFESELKPESMMATETKGAFAAPNAPCDGEKFDGVDRKAAKISVSSGALEVFADLKTFLDELKKIPDDVIDSKIVNSGVTSNRVKEEKRNIKIEKTWLYTFKRQSDEDYHLIIGTTSNYKTAKFFNVEIGGLPLNNSNSFTKIKAARSQFFGFFGWNENSCPAQSYTEDFKNKPIQVSVTGSMFFDKLHYGEQGPIGPSWARGSTYWELHPLTAIYFFKK